jgi:hypothetical protein
MPDNIELRDFMAAHVIAALVGRGFITANAASYAYEFADALLKERLKVKKEAPHAQDPGR